MVPPPDDRSPLAIAASWATVAITISLEMAAPCLAGYGLDYWLGTLPAFVSVGALLGLFAGMTHLLKMTKPPGTGSRPDRNAGRPGGS